jgi:hypothetical protein
MLRDFDLRYAMLVHTLTAAPSDRPRPPSFQAMPGSLAPDWVHLETDHSFPSFQAIPGRLAAPDRMCPGTDHAFPSFQAIPGSLAAPDRMCPGTDHVFPSLREPFVGLTMVFRCKSTTNHYIEHRRKVPDIRIDI